MKKNLHEILTLKFISYNDLKVSLTFFDDYSKDDTKKILKKNGNKIFIGYKRFLLAFWVLFIKLNDFKIIFKKLKKYKKVYTVVKGPKCHKKGKHILKYELYSYKLIIKKPISKNKTLNNLEEYFYSYLNTTLLLNSNYGVTNKVLLKTYVNIF